MVIVSTEKSLKQSFAPCSFASTVTYDSVTSQIYTRYDKSILKFIIQTLWYRHSNVINQLARTHHGIRTVIALHPSKLEDKIQVPSRRLAGSFPLQGQSIANFDTIRQILGILRLTHNVLSIELPTSHCPTAAYGNSEDYSGTAFQTLLTARCLYFS